MAQVWKGMTPASAPGESATFLIDAEAICERR